MKIKETKKQVEESINKGVLALETFHKKVALAPFDFFQKFSALEKKSLAVKKSNQDVIESIYKTIRELNSRLSEVADKMIKKLESEPKLSK